MKYKLGDFVRFVDERREGYVTRIIDNEMIGVTGDDDFEIPVLASKVTYVHGHEPKTQAGITVSKETALPNQTFQNNGVFLGVVSDNKAASVVHFHIINETSYQLLATLTTEKQQTYKGEFAGIIAPQTNTAIYSAQLADIQQWPKFNLQVLFFTTQNVKPANAINFQEKFSAKSFSGTKSNLPLVKQPGWLIRLDEPEVKIDAQKLKESFFKPASEKQEIGKPSSEIDLHIEKLRTDYQFLSGQDILQIQLEQFCKNLEAAIVHQLPEITFIHGTGNGILRHELHKQLGKHPKVNTFMDARKEKFGYGATKVILK